jgi:hypothetical protein
MDNNSYIYTSIAVKNSEHNSNKVVSKIFVKSDNANTPKTNQYIEKILELTSIASGVKSYDYILGWEAAKIILPKICVNLKYIVKICINYKSVNFICGFNHYLSLNYSKFEFEIDVNVYQKLYNTNLLNANSMVKYKKIILTDASNNYDTIISCDYSLASNLHNKGYYMLMVSAKDVKAPIMYSAFIFKNIKIIDVTVLSEIFILCNTIQNKSRLKEEIIKKTSISFVNRHEEYVKLIESDMNVDEIVKMIDARHQSLHKFDYVSIWFKNNEELGKLNTVSNDIIDFSIFNLTINDDKQHDNNENKDNSK